MIDLADYFVTGFFAGLFIGIGNSVSEWFKLRWTHKVLDKLYERMKNIQGGINMGFFTKSKEESEKEILKKVMEKWAKEHPNQAPDAPIPFQKVAVNDEIMLESIENKLDHILAILEKEDDPVKDPEVSDQKEERKLRFYDDPVYCNRCKKKTRITNPIRITLGSRSYIKGECITCGKKNITTVKNES